MPTGLIQICQFKCPKFIWIVEMVKKVKTGQIDVNIFDECFHETEGKRRDDKK